GGFALRRAAGSARRRRRRDPRADPPPGIRSVGRGPGGGGGRGAGAGRGGAVQEAMEEEGRLRAEAMLVQATGAIMEEAGIKPAITIRQGDPVKAVSELLKERDDFSALDLGAAAEGGPGPLVTHFAGAAVGGLPCPLIIVPGGLSEGALARLG